MIPEPILGEIALKVSFGWERGSIGVAEGVLVGNAAGIGSNSFVGGGDFGCARCGRDDVKVES